MHRFARRIATVALASAAVMGITAGPALAGEQAIVDKGIGFLDQISSKAKHSTCDAFAQELASRKLPNPSTPADFKAALDKDADMRRAFITKRAGGLTQDQNTAYEAKLAQAAADVTAKATECKFIDANAKPAATQAPATGAAPTTLVIDNPLDPAHPITLPLPAFLASFAANLPAGSSVK